MMSGVYKTHKTGAELMQLPICFRINWCWSEEMGMKVDIELGSKEWPK